MKKLWMSWSTGKDSAYSLYELSKRSDIEITGLFTTVNETFGRVAMHATRKVLLQLQAEALDLPIEIINIPENCSDETYNERMQNLITKAKDAGVTAMGFGDLFLEDIRMYRENLLAESGIEPIFPLWKRPTKELAQEMIDSGIQATITCVDPKKLSSSFAGRLFNSATILDFPNSVDHCGENGEFHTFVSAAPNFKNTILIKTGEVVVREGFVFADVLPA